MVVIFKWVMFQFTLSNGYYDEWVRVFIIAVQGISTRGEYITAESSKAFCCYSVACAVLTQVERVEEEGETQTLVEWQNTFLLLNSWCQTTRPISMAVCLCVRVRACLGACVQRGFVSVPGTNQLRLQEGSNQERSDEHLWHGRSLPMMLSV